VDKDDKKKDAGDMKVKVKAPADRPIRVTVTPVKAQRKGPVLG
jgi:hypothetical protein